MIDSDVLEAIEELALRGETAVAIERHLAVRFGDRLPGLRTIQRVVRDVAPGDPGARWHLAPDEPEPGLLLAVTAASLEQGWRLPISIAEARWIRLVHHAAPELGPIATRTVARLYLAAETRRASAAALDLALGIGPWRGQKERARYEALVPEPRPSFLLNRQLAER